MMSFSSTNWQETDGGHDVSVFCFLKVLNKFVGLSVDSSILGAVKHSFTRKFSDDFASDTRTHHQTNNNFLNKAQINSRNTNFTVILTFVVP
jgi:hypothetical protein